MTDVASESGGDNPVGDEHEDSQANEA